MVSKQSWICAPCNSPNNSSKYILISLHRTEHSNQAKKREGDLKMPALVQSNEALAEPLKIPGMNYLEVNINGKGFERSLLFQLSAWNFAYDPLLPRPMTFNADFR
jgi:hypothetical protein